jgi:multidrug efflux system membrane fusion protein
MQKYHRPESPSAKGLLVIRLLKRVLAIAVVAGLAGVIIYASTLPSVQKHFTGRRAKMPSNGPIPVTAMAARIDDVPIYLEGVGTAKARKTVTVRPQVDGRILSINFKEGQDVKRGDLLARIDPATYQAQLDQSVAKKVLDEADLANARRDLDRYVKLGADIVSQKSIDTQVATVAKLVAQVKLDAAAIANAKAYLEYCTILAPIDGRTGIRMVDEGNLVRGSDASQGIVVITELRPVSVLFTIPQQQLAEVQKARAKGVLGVEALDADARSTLDHGTLQVVDNQVDPATGTVKMKAEFPNANLQLWPGQFVNVRLLIDTLSQVVVIPTPAVQRGPSGTFAYVVQPDDRVALHPITVAHQSETQSVIARGIAAGDPVVTTGFSRLKDGTSVKVAAPEGQAPAANPEAAARPEARAHVRAACAADVQRFCAGVEERGAIRACLQANAAQLSEACRTAARGPARRGPRSESDGKARKEPVREAERSSKQ